MNFVLQTLPFLIIDIAGADILCIMEGIFKISFPKNCLATNFRMSCIILIKVRALMYISSIRVYFDGVHLIVH